MAAQLGWVWAGDKATVDGGTKHGYPCFSRTPVQALCDIQVLDEDQGIPTVCPGCGLGPMRQIARIFRFRDNPPCRPLVTLKEAIAEMERLQPKQTWEPSPPLSPEKEAEMEEIGRLLR